MILRTTRLILVPTTLVIDSPSYRTFFSSLLSDPLITGNGWDDWNPTPMTDESCLAYLRRKNETTWQRRGLGDFAVADAQGLNEQEKVSGDKLYTELATDTLVIENLNWIGYGCIR